MATDKGYLDIVLERLKGIKGITYRAMMGEYVLYYRGKVIGGIYDNRFLVKPTESAKRLIENAVYELPYNGAKDMILITNDMESDFIGDLFEEMYAELPEPKKKK